jgi:hypothetical protein
VVPAKPSLQEVMRRPCTSNGQPKRPSSSRFGTAHAKGLGLTNRLVTQDQAPILRFEAAHLGFILLAKGCEMNHSAKLAE